MAFVKPSVKKTKTTLNSLRIYLRATAKWGKTSLFRDMILEEYDGNPEKGLLVGIGNETGYSFLDELNTTHVESWSDMEELKSWYIHEASEKGYMSEPNEYKESSDTEISSNDAEKYISKNYKDRIIFAFLCSFFIYIFIYELNNLI